MIALGAFGLTAGLTWWFCVPSSPFHVLDYPNARSLHEHPVPRSGGVAILVALGLGVALLGLIAPLPDQLIWVISGVAVLAWVAFKDDRQEVAPLYRLVSQLGAAGLAVFGGLDLNALELPGWTWDWPGWLAGFSALFLLVWMINLYNFMDGMDGFAGGMAVIGFGTFALAGWRAGDPVFAMLNGLVAVTVWGFLPFNFPPARIFMGDVGSSTLGFLAGVCSIFGSQRQVFPLWVALLIFSPFIVDATVTLLRRARKGERLWQAHREHYYQRLVRSGWGHRRTVLAEYGLMLIFSAAALWAGSVGPGLQWVMLGGSAATYVVLMRYVARLERRVGTVR